MGLKNVAASVLAGVICVQPLSAQNMIQVPTSNGNPAPVSVVDPINTDTPEEIAKDSARDLKDSRFYNRPGATRAQYDADWQECRLIARGSRTPTGTVPYYYNPAVISPLAAGIGAGIGGAIAAAIAEGQQRRANRRACLLIRGWRMVEVPPVQATKVQAMTDAQRDAYFSSIVGAESIDGKVTERTGFTQPVDAAFALDAPAVGPTSFYMGKKVDPAAPFALGPNEAAIVVVYRRTGPLTAGRAGVVQFTRYDPVGRDLIYQPKDWKKKGDRTVYGLDAPTRDKTAGLEVHVLRVTPGDYVIAATAVGVKITTSSNCFGAPTFHVNAGEATYVGDFIPFWNAKLANGSKASMLAYTARFEDARIALATKQPTLAAAMKPATLYNRATYACSAITMDRWDIPGASDLPAPAPTTVAATGG